MLCLTDIAGLPIRSEAIRRWRTGNILRLPFVEGDCLQLFWSEAIYSPLVT